MKPRVMRDAIRTDTLRSIELQRVGQSDFTVARIVHCLFFVALVFDVESRTRTRTIVDKRIDSFVRRDIK